MNRQDICFAVVLVVVVAGVLFFAQQSFAASEDQAISILERVLDVVASFLEKVFDSLADAIRSLWS